MTPDLLVAVAIRLYGPQWKRPLAKALPRNEKSIQRYLKMARVPEAVQARLRKLVSDAQWDLTDLASIMDGKCPNGCGALVEDNGVPTCDLCGWYLQSAFQSKGISMHLHGSVDDASAMRQEDAREAIEASEQNKPVIRLSSGD